MTIARQVHLVRRPNGVPVPEDFAVVEAQVPDAGEGEIQVEGLILSVDPYMRPRLDADQKLGEAMAGGGILPFSQRDMVLALTPNASAISFWVLRLRRPASKAKAKASDGTPTVSPDFWE